MITQLLAGYLVAWLWVLGIVVGALPLLLIHQLTGGDWGDALRAPLITAASTLPLVALAFVPVLLGLDALYPWTHDWSGPTWYLDRPFFVARAIFYFVAWFAVAQWCVRRPDDAPRTMAASAIGLIVYLLTASLAAFDWVMSLTPEWHSTVFGLLFAAGQVLAALAFTVTMVLVGPTKVDAPDVCNDFGNLLLTFTMLWAYLAYTQYLIIWIGNLPHDIGWYVVRGQTGWRWLGLFVIVLGLAAPCVALLLKAVKRVPSRLLVVAGGTLAMRAVDLYWTVVPTFRKEGFDVRMADPLIFVVVIVGWLLLYRRRQPVLRASHAH